MIMRLYANLFDSEHGWRRVLWFSVVMNVNLALLNLLPFPVLDGGHIALALIEAVRRRPVSAEAAAIPPKRLRGGADRLSCSFIAFFDTGDWVRSARKGPRRDSGLAPK